MTTARRAKGRRTARVKTPLLVRACLMREEFSSENDPDEQAARRLAQEDYLSRMHRRVRHRMRQLRPRCLYARHHSFQALLNNLVPLGLVE